jgi:hypothetical protein
LWIFRTNCFWNLARSQLQRMFIVRNLEFLLLSGWSSLRCRLARFFPPLLLFTSWPRPFSFFPLLWWSTRLMENRRLSIYHRITQPPAQLNIGYWTQCRYLTCRLHYIC